MCLTIDSSVKSSNKRTVWKIFDRNYEGRITSLYQSAAYPLNKLIVRDEAEPVDQANGYLSHCIHVFTSKRAAQVEAGNWDDAYIAKLKVDPKDFLAADADGQTAGYHQATRVGKYIRVRANREK